MKAGQNGLKKRFQVERGESDPPFAAWDSTDSAKHEMKEGGKQE